MPEVALIRLTSAPPQIHDAPEPLPDELVVDGVRFVRAHDADVHARRPAYVEAPEAPPYVRLCMHGCPTCGAVRPCGERSCATPGRARRCPECMA